MASIDMSLDDIIQKKIVKTSVGRGRLRKGQQRGDTLRNIKKNVPTRKRGGVAKVNDARLKIIQNKRQKLTDARDKLAEIAKQSDAREKLEKLRLKRIKGRSAITPAGANITRRTGRNGQMLLSTNKSKELWARNKDHTLANPRGFRNKTPALLDMDIDLNEDHELLPPVIRRTVNNEIPYRGHGVHDSGPLPWVRDGPPSPASLLAERHPLIPSHRSSSTQSSSLEAIVRNTTARYHKNHGSLLLSERDEWKRENPLLKSSSLRLAAASDDTEEDGIWSRRMSSELKARLDTPTSMHHAPSTPQGHRIVVSNLQPSVTQEDIRELFEDIGTLLASRLVRPGTAEVIYARLEDALRAVDVYHNRQLDGQPMKCMLVNPRPPVIQSGSRSSSSGLRSSSDVAVKLPSGTKSSVAPDVGTIHKALFNK